MSAISLKSITGITSITTPAGVDNVFTVHTNDTTERFRIDQSGNQRIAGILTVTQDLDVDGHTNLDNTDIVGILTVTSTTQYGGYKLNNNSNVVGELVGLSGSNDTGALALWSGGSKYVQLSASGNSYINGGNIGIGTNNPQCLLDMSKDISGGVNYVDIRNHHATGGAALRVKTQGTYASPTYQGILGASDAGGTIRVGAVSNHPLLLLVNNQEKLRIATDGLVGIGTAAGSSSSTRLVVYNESGNAQTIEIKAKNTTGAGSQPGLRFTAPNNDNIGAIYGDVNSDSLRFATSIQERLRITSTGQVNIGTGELSQTDRMLNVHGGRQRITYTGPGNSFELFNSASAGSSYGLLIQAGTNSSDYNSTFRNTSGTTLFRIRGDGRIGIGKESPAGKLHISSGNSGDCVLIIEADEDNNDENDNPRIEFRQDGGVGVSAIGHGLLSGNQNGLVLANGVGTGYISFATGTVDGHVNATERLRITSAGKISYNYDGSAVSSVADVDIRTNNGIHIRGQDANSNNTNIYIGGAVGNQRKTAIIHDPVGGYCRGDLHFCLENSADLSDVDVTDSKMVIKADGKVGINQTSPSGKLHIGGIGNGDIIAELTTGSPMFTYRNGSSSWMHAGKHPSNNEFIISEGASTTAVEMLRIQGGGGATDSKFKFPSVKAAAAHGVSTADVEIAGRHIWKRITSSYHVTTATNVNHFYLAFFRSSSGNNTTSYFRGVVVNVVASGNYDWGGHGYVTHTSQTILTFSSTTGGRHHSVINSGYSYLQNNSANMRLQGVGFSYDSNYLYANFRFYSDRSGTGWKPHYNVEVIDPSQCIYTCVAF